MKTARNSKLIIIALATAAFVALANASVFWLTKPAKTPPPSQSATAPPDGAEQGPQDGDAKNSYPLPPTDTVYGGLQRLGSSGEDGVGECYFLKDFIFVVYSAGNADYDSDSARSLNIAKLDARGVIIKTRSIAKDGVYLSSAPVWNGLVVCFQSGASERALYLDFELDAVAEYDTGAPSFSSRLFFSLVQNRLYHISTANSDAALTVVCFDEGLAPLWSRTAALLSSAAVFDVYGAEGGAAVFAAFNRESGFFVYKLSLSPSAPVFAAQRAAGGSPVSVILPHKDGFAVACQNSGSLRLYDKEFQKIGEKSFDGQITSLTKTLFGYALTAQTADNATEVSFLCPHFDGLASRPHGEKLISADINGSAWFYSSNGGYFNFYTLSDFELNARLTISSAAVRVVYPLYSASAVIFVVEAQKLSAINSYGETDVFIIVVDKL
ncbi:MAG: hypothetical protein LBQ40_00295 [Clostridiales bacterium]|jgi:hypothetical protein|nr:hypothetical protein [Clostridiales bacterium]